jgi:hypothetical protein
MRQLKHIIFLLSALFAKAFIPYSARKRNALSEPHRRELLPFSTTMNVRERIKLSESFGDESVDIFDFKIAESVFKGLWYLPLLSILSGFTPAARIIAESHVSRLPDTPIAHDIDTFLLWPYGDAAEGSFSKTIFQTPAAAITDQTMYDVDWNAVREAFAANVEVSFQYSGLIAISLYLYLCVGKNKVNNY